MPDVMGQTMDATDWLSRHRRHPRGAVGALVGRLTALGNGKLIRIALDRLEPTDTDQVLEVGCGAGRAIEVLLTRVQHGFITGVDHSAVMARLAIRRNIEAIDLGRLEVRQAPVSRLPYLDGWFAKAFSIESFRFWPEPDHDVAEVRRVLKPGGRLVLVFRHRGSDQLEKRAVGAMERAGLTAIDVERHGRGGNVPVSVVGTAPRRGLADAK